MTNLVETKKALQNHVHEYVFDIQKAFSYDLDETISLVYQLFFNILISNFSQVINEGYAFKILCAFKLRLHKFSFELEHEIKEDFWFASSESHLILTKHEIESALIQCIADSLHSFDSFVQTGSGWVLKSVKQIKLRLIKFKVFRGGCFRQILPQKYRNSKSLVFSNSANNVDCFLRAIVLTLVSKYSQKRQNRTRWSKLCQELYNIFPVSFIKFPVSLKEAVSFEKQTPFSLNIFGLSGKDNLLFPYYVSSAENKKSSHIDLLFHNDHYYGITNLGALVRSVTSKNTRICHVCPYCMSNFSSLNSFKIHKYLCLNKTQPLQFPVVGNHIKTFTNYTNLVEAPFVIYADLESIICKKKFVPKGSNLKQIYTQDHECIAWCSYTVCRPNNAFSSVLPIHYIGANAIQSFFNHIESEFFRISKILQDVDIPLTMTDEDNDLHATKSFCQFCLVQFSEENQKVRDHCHLSGKFRFSLCSDCNLTYAAKNKKRHKVIVLFHGLSNYDSHFLIQEIHTLVKRKKLAVSVIPRTSEKYLSFSVGGIQYKDTYQFLGASLAQLVKDLVDKSKSHFTFTKQVYFDPKLEEVIYGKGVFPYNYLTSLKVLEEKHLPPKSEFFNDLTQEHISDADYNFAQRAWLLAGCKTFGDYLLLYLTLDVLLLADVMENFRSACMIDYELDPVHYFSAAHYTFDAYMRKSGVEFELLTDVNQYFFCLQGIRGGLSMVAHKRFSEANNKFMKEFDESKPSKFLIDLDANNLYGRCMMDHLPYADFEWCLPSDELVSEILQLSDTSEKGYLLQVDLEYDSRVHDLHEDYPLAPHKCTKKIKDLSPFSQSIVEEHNLKKSTGFEKLMATLDKKQYYIIHYRNLQLYLRHGLILKKVHRILKFSQAPIMRGYIEYNSAKRAESANDFDSSLFKLLSNSLYGKTIERADNKTMIKLITDIEKYEKEASKVTMKNCKIINPHLVGMEMKHPILKIDKPVYLGTVILELAKFYMYQFHYEVMKPHFGERIKLLYTDTDSLLYEVFTDDIFSDYLDLPENTFDFSNFPKSHSLFNDSNKRVPGCFKDETKGRIIKSFVGLKSKMYAILMDDTSLPEIKVAKGVKKAVINKDLTFDQYQNCLVSNKVQENEYVNLRSVKHSVFTSCQSKISLSSFDDKRWILEDGIHSLPYGHYKIESTTPPPLLSWKMGINQTETDEEPVL